MLQDQWDRIRIFFTRLKIEFPALAVFPRFRTTLALLGLLGVYGVLHGHVVAQGADARAVSVTLSMVSWLGAAFIVLLRNPLPRLKILVTQLVSILLFGCLVIAIAVAYAMWFAVSRTPESLKVAWLVASGLLAYLMVVTGYRGFVAVDYREPGYPGRRTTPLLFLLAVLNALWWYWPGLVQWVR